MYRSMLKPFKDVAKFVLRNSVTDMAKKTNEKWIKITHQNRQNVLIKNYFETNKVHKLQIGCGNNMLDGWLNTDLDFRLDENVISMDASKPFPFKDESFDYIFSEHLFEHIDAKGELVMLRECFRILKKGGKIRIATPNLDFLVKLYTENKSIVQKEYIVWATNKFLPTIKKEFTESQYQDVFVINNFFRDFDHQLVHNFNSLKLFLEKGGFSNVKQTEIGVSEDPVYFEIEKHGNIIPKAFNELETIVVEARK